MVLTFWGHSNFQSNADLEEKMLEILNNIVGIKPADLYLGGYGSFDDFALACAKKFQRSHPQIKIIFVTPYITESYQKNRLADARTVYDEIIYPELENVPAKFAINHRNRWMIDKSDFVITHIKKSHGGAYEAYKYAKNQNKNIMLLN